MMNDTVITGGQIVLPLPIQTALGVHEGSRVSLTVEEGRLIIEPLRHDPIQAMQELFQGKDYSLEEDLKQFRASQW